MAKDYLLEKRKFVIGGIAVFIVLTYILRLLVLQVMTDDYKKNADSNAFLKKTQYQSHVDHQYLNHGVMMQKCSAFINHPKSKKMF